MNELSPLILVVEDDEDDRFLLEEVIRETTPHCQIAFAKDGYHALEVLALLASPPTFILTDLNMPRMNGIELLKALKASEKWQLVPVIIFTTTPTPENVHDAYTHNANSFIGKPASYRDLAEIWLKVFTLWGKMAKRPSRGQ